LLVFAIVTTTIKISISCVDDFAISGSAKPLTAVAEIARYSGDPLLFHSDCIVHSAGSALCTSSNSKRTVDPGTIGSNNNMSDGLSSIM